LTDLDDTIDLADLTNIYQVYTEFTENENGVKVWTNDKYYWVDGNNFDGNKYKKLNPDDKTTTQIVFNGDELTPVDIRETYIYILKNPKDIRSIKIGDAIICEMCYSQKTINYDLE
jgi:hypothetical protein